MSSDSRDASSRQNQELEMQQIRDALRGLRFGSVNVIVQDGVVVQIDRIEKRRIRKPLAGKDSSASPQH